MRRRARLPVECTIDESWALYWVLRHVRKRSGRSRASVVHLTQESVLRVVGCFILPVRADRESALLGIHGANSGAGSGVDANATAAVSATCDGVAPASQTPRLWAH